MTRSLMRVQRTSAAASDFKDRFDLDRHIGRQGHHADGGPRVASEFSEQRHVEIGCAIDHFCDIEKIGVRLHEAAHAHHALEGLQ